MAIDYDLRVSESAPIMIPILEMTEEMVNSLFSLSHWDDFSLLLGNFWQQLEPVLRLMTGEGTVL